MSTLDRYSSTIGLLIVVGVFGAAALVAAAGRLPEPALATPTPALIYILSTPVPTIVPTPDTQVLQELAALRARVAELEAQQKTGDIVSPVSEPIYQQAVAPQSAPTMPPPPTPEPVQLQAVIVHEGEEPLTGAQMREAMDQ